MTAEDFYFEEVVGYHIHSWWMQQGILYLQKQETVKQHSTGGTQII
jgi:hypothetical protein